MLRIFGCGWLFTIVQASARVLRTSSPPTKKNLPDQMAEQTLYKSPKLLFSDNHTSMLI